MIEKTVEGGGIETTMNSVVEVVGKTWDRQPRLRVETTIPPQPQRMAASPSGGGPVSLGLQNTVAGALQDVQNRTSKVEAEIRRQPVVLPRTTPPATSTGMFQIIGGNALAYLPGSVGVKKVTSAITTIPAGYLNGSPSTTIDGVGWARSMDDDSFVLVVNDSLSLVSHDLLMGTPVLAVQAASIADDAGGFYKVYRITGAI
jgi:hypothetical protein